MSLLDKERWNTKYKNNQVPNAPIKLLQDYLPQTIGKKALDIACGMGRHSRYLASKGFNVDALDISSVAIKNLENLENIHPKEVDFDTYVLDKERYDLVVCTYFLERSLFPQMVDALKTNGILLMETFLHDKENEKVPSNPDFLLKKGELESYFSKVCELVYIHEWQDIDSQGYKTSKISMLARKI